MPYINPPINYKISEHPHWPQNNTIDEQVANNTNNTNYSSLSAFSFNVSATVPPRPIFGPKMPILSPQPILKNKLLNNTNNSKPQIVLENQPLPDKNIKKSRGPNENGISTLQLLQNIAKRIKEENPNIKHRQAIALAGEEYRQQNQTIRAPKHKLQKATKKSKPCQKCKYCKK